MFVGNFKPHKNLGRLIEALAKVRQRRPVRLVVIGRTEGFITGDEPVLARARAMPEAVILAGETTDTLIDYLPADTVVCASADLPGAVEHAAQEIANRFEERRHDVPIRKRWACRKSTSGATSNSGRA